MQQRHIALAVKAVFALNLSSDLTIPMSKYEFGLFAEQDYRVVNSQWWSTAMDIVRLQKVDVKPLTDKPREGERNHEDSKALMSNEQEEERLALLKRATLLLAILSRAAESLAEKARKDSEKVGNKTEDGGRIRFNLNYGARQFRPYHKEFNEFLKDLTVDAEPGSPWAAKIEEAHTVQFPLVDATQAMSALHELFGDDQVEELGHKAWAKLLESLALYGEAIERNAKACGVYNASDKTEADTKLFAAAGKTFRRETKDAQYWAERFMEPTALLASTGTPSWLINTPFWRAEAAKVKAMEAEAEAMEAEALATEAMAKTLMVKANMKLQDALELQDEMEAELAATRAAMRARKAAREAKATAVIQQSATMVEPAPLTNARVNNLAPRVITQRGAVGFGH